MRELPKDLPAPFGRYRLLKLLGQGGMGAVYLAHDTQLDRQVALKIPLITAEDGGQHLERFYREARAAAALHHPNLCPVHDVGESDGLPYLTMAYIEGKPLADFASGPKAVTPRQSAALVRKLAAALAEAHKHGIIHRDLKPANIMIDRRSEPIVMDFGLARRTRRGDARLTQSGDILGTPAYMPPEQVSGDLNAMGPSCDIYSLGVVLYELLAGRLPFEGDVMAMLSQVLLDEPAPPSKFRPDLDPDLEAICLKAMAKKSDDRYASMNELAAALLEYLRGKNQTASPVSTLVPATKAAMETQQPGIHLSDLGGLRSVAQLAAHTPTKKASEKTPRRRKTARRRGVPLWIWLAGVAGLAALVLLVSGVILYEATNYGNIRIEPNVPASAVRLKVDGQPHSWGETLRLGVGPHDLEAEGEGYQSVKQKLTIRHGDNPLFQVAFQATNFPPSAAAAGQTSPPGQGELVRQIEWPGGGTVYAMAISPGGLYYLASGDRDTIRVWEVTTGKKVHEVPGFLGNFTPDGNEILTGTRANSEFRVFLTSTGTLDHEFKGNEVLDNLWLVPKTNQFVTATRSGLSLWTLQGERRIHWDCNPGKSPILFTPDGKDILLRKDGDPWQAIDVATLTPKPKFPGLATLQALDGFTSDGQRVYGIRGNKLVFSDVSTGNEARTIDLGDSPVDAVTLSADDQRVLTAHNDHTVRLWEVNTGRELCHFSTAEINRVARKTLAISADGKYACAGGAPGRVYLWRLP